MSKLWTPTEDAYLKSHYWTDGSLACSLHLGRSIKGTRYRAEFLKIKGQRKGVPRSVFITAEQELEILKRHGQKEQLKDISLTLKIPIHIVKRTLRSHGIGPKPNRSILLAAEIGKDYMELKLNGDQLCAKYAMSKSQIARVVKAQGLDNPNRRIVFQTDINKHRAGLTNHQLWTRRYGKEEADKREQELRTRRSEQSSGSKNLMYGKTSPQGAGNGWKGWYKEHYFRSLREASYMLKLDAENISWSSAEKLIIPYTLEGKNRTYRPDYRVGNRLVEIKPLKLHNSPSVVAKRIGAEIYCASCGLTYEIIDVPIDVRAIEEALTKGLIRFDRDYETRFLNWKNSQTPNPILLTGETT